ncbi:hypothetical protein HZA57_09705 [Candidatus Poribacteria bacterium]|nr:hypothetical protein [Candidatus Poribacteria bacterium]
MLSWIRTSGFPRLAALAMLALVVMTGHPAALALSCPDSDCCQVAVSSHECRQANPGEELPGGTEAPRDLCVCKCVCGGAVFLTAAAGWTAHLPADLDAPKTAVAGDMADAPVSRIEQPPELAL